MSIFDTKVSSPTDAALNKQSDVMPVPTVLGAKLPAPSDKPVMVAQTLDDRRAYPTWPRYDAMDVRSVRRPRYGRDY